MKSYESFVQSCDIEIRAGRIHEASKLLTQLNAAKIPRPWQLPLAKLCRRTGLYTLGLRLLENVINGKEKFKEAASAAELAEYAVLLLRCGAVPEALERLQNIDPSEAAEVHLYRAFCRFLQWRYTEAIEDLENYLRTPMSDYSKLIAQTNLAMANVEIRRHDRALSLLESLNSQLDPSNFHQLRNTCHALRAQVFLQENQLLKARRELARISNGPVNSSSNSFLVKKCELTVVSLETRDVAPLLELQRLAVDGHFWEAAREADLYRLKIAFNQERFVHLYFGTPFEEFRQLFETELGARPDRTTYILGKKSAPRLDLKSGEINDHAFLKVGSKIHQLIEVLLRDFYHPLRIPGLFSALFPGEHFNISSSPGRVRQIIHRTRQVLQHEKIPVKIAESDGFYSLEIEGQFSIRVPLQHEQIDSYGRILDLIQQAFAGGEMFTAKEIEERLSLPKSTVHKILTWCLEKKKLSRSGSTNRSIKYKIAA